MATITGAENIQAFLNAFPNASMQMSAPAINPYFYNALGSQAGYQATAPQTAGPGGVLGGAYRLITGMVDPFARALTTAQVALTPDEQKRREIAMSYFGVEDPNLLQEGLKSAAGIGAWLVPGLGQAGTLGNVLTRGALAGGLGSLSTQNFLEPGGFDPGALAKGAMMGAGTSALAYGAGKGIQALQARGGLGGLGTRAGRLEEQAMRGGMSELEAELASATKLGLVTPDQANQMIMASQAGGVPGVVSGVTGREAQLADALKRGYITKDYARSMIGATPREEAMRTLSASATSPAQTFAQPKAPLSLTDQIIAFESGELSGPETIQLFQDLVDNGQAWKLQGSYGRTAKDLIDQGLVRLPTKAGMTDYYGNFIPTRAQAGPTMTQQAKALEAAGVPQEQAARMIGATPADEALTTLRASATAPPATFAEGRLPTGMDAQWSATNPRLKQQFDTALMSGNADEVTRLLPEVPRSYRAQYMDQIKNVLQGKPAQTGALTDILGREGVDGSQFVEGANVRLDQRMGYVEDLADGSTRQVFGVKDSAGNLVDWTPANFEWDMSTKVDVAPLKGFLQSRGVDYSKIRQLEDHLANINALEPGGMTVSNVQGAMDRTGLDISLLDEYMGRGGNLNVKAISATGTAPPAYYESPRAISEDAVQAFQSKMPFKRSNTQVVVDDDGVSKLLLHDNEIARIGPDGLEITDAGWATRTTRERLNTIPGVEVRVKNGQQYLNGKEWDGAWTKIGGKGTADTPVFAGADDTMPLGTRYHSTDAWRGYEIPRNAVAGASDTGTWADSPAPSNLVDDELQKFTKELKAQGFNAKIMEQPTESSNVFMAKRWISVPDDEVEAASRYVQEAINNRKFGPDQFQYVHDALDNSGKIPSVGRGISASATSEAQTFAQPGALGAPQVPVTRRQFQKALQDVFPSSGRDLTMLTDDLFGTDATKVLTRDDISNMFVNQGLDPKNAADIADDFSTKLGLEWTGGGEVGGKPATIQPMAEPVTKPTVEPIGATGGEPPKAMTQTQFDAIMAQRPTTGLAGGEIETYAPNQIKDVLRGYGVPVTNAEFKSIMSQVGDRTITADELTQIARNVGFSEDKANKFIVSLQRSKLPPEMTGISKGGRWGVEETWRGAGVEPVSKKGRLDVVDKYKGDVDILEWARQRFTPDAVPTPEIIPELRDSAGRMRWEEIGKLEKMGEKYTVGDIIKDAQRGLMKTSNLTPQEAEQQLMLRLQEGVGSNVTTGNQGALNAWMKGETQIGPTTMFELTQDLGSDTAQVLQDEFQISQGGTPKWDVRADAGRHLDTAISGQLGQQSENFKRATRLFEALYRNEPGISRAYNRWGGISTTGGKINLLRQWIEPRVQTALGQAAKKGSEIVTGRPVQLNMQPGGTYAVPTSQVTPQMMGKAQGAGLFNLLPEGVKNALATNPTVGSLAQFAMSPRGQAIIGSTAGRVTTTPSAGLVLGNKQDVGAMMPESLGMGTTTLGATGSPQMAQLGATGGTASLTGTPTQTAVPGMVPGASGISFMDLFNAALQDTGNYSQAMQLTSFLAPYLGIPEPGAGGNTLSATQQNKYAQQEQAQSYLNQLYQSYQNVGGQTGIGPVDWAVGGIRNLGAGVGLGQNLRSYEQLRQGITPLLYQAIRGSGVMPEKTIERALGLIPSAQDTPQQAMENFQILWDLLESNKQTIRAAPQYVDTGNTALSYQNPLEYQGYLTSAY